MRFRLLLVFGVVALVSACASSTRPGAVGVTREQLFIVSAAEVEQLSSVHYANQVAKARSSGKLVASGPEYDRLVKIGNRIIRQASTFRDDTGKWKWQMTLIDAPTLNASCAPGGKITFYAGIIRRLQLTDAEIAAVMGHEVAHALREHGREKVSLAQTRNLVTRLAFAQSSNRDQQLAAANQLANILLTLPNSRESESEADRIGLELMARAGYDPQAAVRFWQKMANASGGNNQIELLSTHPVHASRIAELTALQPRVRPLFEAAAKP